MDILQFISETYFIIIAVLYIVGMSIKETEKIKDKYIPVILIVVGMIACSALAASIGEPIINGIFQGVLCAGASVLTNQTRPEKRNN